VADGLATAHGAAILHRDVKPGHILAARNGYAKLADFGAVSCCSIPVHWSPSSIAARRTT
jgi:serine/threonine protein kinase